MSLIEESEDAIVEELSVGGGVTTLGGMDNVSEEADKTSETDDIIVRLAGASEWTVNTTLFSNVSQLMSKVFPFTLSLAGEAEFMRKEVRKQLIFRGVMTGMLHHSLSMESQCLLTAGQNNIRMLQLIQRILCPLSIMVKFIGILPP